VNSLRDFWLRQQSRPEKGLEDKESIVLRSDLHLSRNLKDLPFQERLNAEKCSELSEQIIARMRKMRSFRKSLSCNLATLMEEERLSLQEWGYIFTDGTSPYEGSQVLLKDDGTAGVWICGTHHVCWSAFGKGLSLEVLWRQMSRWESSFKDAEYAFSPLYGYVSSDLGDWGSGLCASVTLHLPAILENGLWRQMVAVLPSLGLKCCPEYRFISLEMLPVVKIFHDGSSGIAPKEALRILKEAVLLVAHRERDERDQLLRKQKLKIWDRVNRSWATLFSCQLLSASEALYCLSNLDLGVYFGWFPKEFLSIIGHQARYLLSGTFRVCVGVKDLQREQEEASRAQYVKQFITMERRPILLDDI
jgi:protein arginine kinase